MDMGRCEARESERSRWNDCERECDWGEKESGAVAEWL